jgi:hypothetical protein
MVGLSMLRENEEDGHARERNAQDAGCDGPIQYVRAAATPQSKKGAAEAAPRISRFDSCAQLRAGLFSEKYS